MIWFRDPTHPHDAACGWAGRPVGGLLEAAMVSYLIAQCAGSRCSTWNIGWGGFWLGRSCQLEVISPEIIRLMAGPSTSLGMTGL